MSEQTFWNGEPTKCTKVRVIVADAAFPLYWAREFIGQEREAVKVELDYDKVFYIDNEDGRGWLKVTEGHGMWRYAHSDLGVEREVTCRPYWNHEKSCGPTDNPEACACGCRADNMFCEGTPKKDHPYYRGQI